MSIAIIGGNDSMIHMYKELGKKHGYKVKVFTQSQGIKNKIGSPDLVVLFTNTVSHKMIDITLSSISNQSIDIIRSHSSSLSALKDILSKYSA